MYIEIEKKNMEYNLYCDENCHLPQANSYLIAIGGFIYPNAKAD